MEDTQIIELYLRRQEEAIAETEAQYGAYLHTVARNLLWDEEDSRECVNDTYLGAWNSIPPNRPAHLLTYLVKITRRTAIDRLRARGRQKRIDSQLCVSLDELEEVLSRGDELSQRLEAGELAAAINAYLRTLPPRSRQVFVSRYYFADSVRSIGQRLHLSEANVKVILHRTRKGLRAYLEKERLLG